MTTKTQLRKRKHQTTSAVKVAYKSNKHRWTAPKLNTDEGDE